VAIWKPEASEISFIQRATSFLRRLGAHALPFLSVFSPSPRSIYLQRLRLFQSAATSGIRKNDVPDDAATLVLGSRSLLPVTPRLRSDSSSGSRESYEVPFGRSRGDSRVFHRRRARILFQFSRLTSLSKSALRNSCKTRSYDDNKSFGAPAAPVRARFGELRVQFDTSPF